MEQPVWRRLIAQSGTLCALPTVVDFNGNYALRIARLDAEQAHRRGLPHRRIRAGQEHRSEPDRGDASRALDPRPRPMASAGLLGPGMTITSRARAPMTNPSA